MIRLLNFCDHRRILLVPVHLLGRCNVQADRLSRPGQELLTEWDIDPELLRPIFSHWGQPWIDVFATFNNKKCSQLVSPFPDPRAAFINALSIPWNWMGMGYAFPPFKVIPTVIAKLRQSVAIAHHDSHSTVQNGRIVNARLATISTGHTHSCVRWSETTKSSPSSNQWRSREPDLPLLHAWKI